MARYRRRDALEESLGRVEAEDRSYDVDLIAKRATGVAGYRMTLAFVAQDGSRSHFVELAPAASRDEVRSVAAALRADPTRLVELLSAEQGDAS